MFYNVPVFYVCHRSSQLMTSQWLGGQVLQRDAVIGCDFFCSWMVTSGAWSAAGVLQDLYNSFILVLLQMCGPLYWTKMKTSIT